VGSGGVVAQRDAMEGVLEGAEERHSEACGGSQGVGPQTKASTEGGEVGKGDGPGREMVNSQETGKKIIGCVLEDREERGRPGGIGGRDGVVGSEENVGGNEVGQGRDCAVLEELEGGLFAADPSEEAVGVGPPWRCRRWRW
jgi:hypothetical protein